MAGRDSFKTLATAISAWAMENLPPFTPLPPGLRLEVHPLAYNRLMQETPPEYHPPLGERLEKVAQVPVVVTPMLETGTWRLVEVTEVVHAQGRTDLWPGRRSTTAAAPRC